MQPWLKWLLNDGKYGSLTQLRAAKKPDPNRDIFSRKAKFCLNPFPPIRFCGLQLNINFFPGCLLPLPSFFWNHKGNSLRTCGVLITEGELGFHFTFVIKIYDDHFPFILQVEEASKQKQQKRELWLPPSHPRKKIRETACHFGEKIRKAQKMPEIVEGNQPQMEQTKSTSERSWKRKYTWWVSQTFSPPTKMK